MTLRLRRYRTKWWAAWCEDMPEMGHVVFLRSSPQGAAAMAGEYYDIEVQELPPGLA